MRYLLNSAVVTAPGQYTYRLVTPAEAREWFKAGPAISTIGYQTTADYLSVLLDHEVQLNRTPCRMEPGDEALVCRFDPSLRLPAGMKSGQDGRKVAEELMTQGRVELGILARPRSTKEDGKSRAVERSVPTLPKLTALRLVFCVLHEHLDRLRTRQAPPGRPQPDANRIEGLARKANTAKQQHRQIGELMAARPKGVIRADVAALLAAAAGGHAEALGDLENLLDDLGHPALDRVAEIEGWNLAAICRVLIADRT